jgi:putative two-component system response regulator
MMSEQTAHLLIVDDQPDNLLVLEDLLGAHYAVHGVTDGSQALAYLNGGGTADLILLDVMMPGMDGYEVCRRLKGAPATRDIPVIFLTSLDGVADETRGLSLGAEDFIHRPFSPPVVLARVRNHLKLARTSALLRERNEDLERLVAARTTEIVRQSRELLQREQEIIAAQSATITAFCALAEARDDETGNHIRRTQNYVRALALRLREQRHLRDQLDDETVRLLFKSAPLHDVGKVAIPDAILLKPGKLTEEEWQVMKRHTEYGRNAIVSAEDELGDAHASFLRHAREIAYSHHEWWDGNGYPEGLAGEAIPLSARLMAVADVYDALISRRVYKDAYSHEHALGAIAAQRSSHFDPAVVDALLDIADEFRDIATRFGDNVEPPQS